jgi:hypothetical protein
MEVIFSPHVDQENPSDTENAAVWLDSQYIVSEAEGLTEAQVKEVAVNLYHALQRRQPTLIIEN